MEKYEYLTGEDLGYKPKVFEQAKFEYYPSGEALNRGLMNDKKDKKVIKYDNNLKCGSMHNFNKYSVSRFNEISSIDSKFDTINKFYKDFKKLNDINSKNENTRKKKITVIKNTLLLYYELIDTYKKV